MKKLFLLTFSISALFLSESITAQTLSLVTDLNPGEADGLDEWNNKGISLNNILILPATNGTTGLELYAIKNGVLSIIKDIYEGEVSSAPDNFILYNGKVYFNAANEDYGVEIWSTDGTPEGTQLAIEVIEGAEPSNGPGKMIVGKNGKLYFSHDGEAYISDGTTAGTSIIEDITFSVDFNDDLSIASPAVCAYGEGIAFYSQDFLTNAVNIYTHDGATLTLKNTFEGSSVTHVYGLSEVAEGLLYATNDFAYEENVGLFIISRTTEETTQIKNASDGSYIVNRLLHFTSQKAIFKDINGGIFATDGTLSGTFKIAPGTYTLYQGQRIPHAVFGDKIIFHGDEDFLTQEIYVSDGTVNGTSIIATLDSPFLSEMIQSGTKAIWTVGLNNGFDPELWSADVSTKTSVKLKSFTYDTHADEAIFPIGVSGTTLYVGSIMGGVGREIYSLDNVVNSVQSGNGNTAAYTFVSAGSNLFYIHSEQTAEALEVVQYDLNGQVLQSIQVAADEQFRLPSNHGLSIVKVKGSEGTNTYKTVMY